MVIATQSNILFYVISCKILVLIFMAKRLYPIRVDRLSSEMVAKHQIICDTGREASTDDLLIAILDMVSEDV